MFIFFLSLKGLVGLLTYTGADDISEKYRGF